MKIPRQLIDLTNKVHQIIFHAPISTEVEKLIQIISHLSIGTFVSILFILPYNILSIRILGPEEYGKFILIQSVAMFISIPMAWGYNTALIKYTSETDDVKIKSEIISTAGITIFSLSLVSTIIFFYFTNFFSNFFSIPSDLFYLSIVFALIYIIYIFSTSLLKGFFEIKILSVLQPMYSLTLLIAFLIGVFVFTQSYFAVFLASIIAYGVFAFLTFIILRKKFSFNFNIPIFKKMSHYAFFAAIGGLSFILCTNVDKLLLNKFLTTADVGIYSAYYTAALMVPSLLGTILYTILFPYASKEKNLLVIFQRLDNLFPYFLTIGGALGCLSTFIFLSLFGKEYPVNFLLIFLFAFAGILVFYCGLIEWVINSVGIKGIKMTCGIDVIIAIGNVVLNIILIPIFGLFGAIFSTIIAFSIGLSILIIKRESVVI